MIDLISLQFNKNSLKIKVLVTLTLTLKSPGGQNYQSLKDFVLICMNIYDNNFMSFSRFFDLGIGFLKVTADSVQYLPISCFTCSIFQALKTNIKAILHETLDSRKK